jgi:hypothetical protein
MRTDRLPFLNSLLALVLLASLSHCIAADIAATTLPDACLTACATPFGETLGSSGAVEAYSNCAPGCINPEPNEWQGTFTGIRWQCVEYVRRWLLVNTGAVYGDVDIAADIWDQVDHLVDVASRKKLPLEAWPNGSTQPPRTGDLLVYARAYLGTGHVAVVTDVDYANGVIEVGEQNYQNTRWPGDYARRIVLARKGDGWWLHDAYLIGWKHPVDPVAD